MSIFVEKAGILTTVQDAGRFGYRSRGINVSGAMDTAAMAMANILVGNPRDEAVLEMHFPAPVLRFEDACLIAVCGADLNAQIDGGPVANGSSLSIRSGQRLSFRNKVRGSRCYLAVHGGFAVESRMGSLSTNLKARFGGFSGRALDNADRLEARAAAETGPWKIHSVSPSIVPVYSSFPTVRIIAGAEFDHLSVEGKQALLSTSFAISRDSNRMGFRLEGRPITSEGRPELVSAAVAFGTIQLLPDGQLIVLMADHQTSGGYPRIGHVISSDLPLIAQVGPGDKVAFHLVTIGEAEALAAKFERELNFLEVGCKLLSTL